jgi:hypothetical protein
MITFISVVRDFKMYDKLVQTNPNTKGAEFVSFDNRVENKPISVRYNEFLNSYDYSKDSWFIFCHEDYEFLEPIEPYLTSLDKNNLYGQVGAIRYGFLGFGMQTIVGNLFCRDRACIESMTKLGMRIKKNTRTETFDCCCLMVHSSLVAKHNLRFDEELLFDFYVEDFCASAFVNFGILSYVIPIKACHYSTSTATDRLFRHLPYLKRKYPKHCFVSTLVYFGNFTWRKKLQDKIMYFLRPLFDKAMRKIGR